MVSDNARERSPLSEFISAQIRAERAAAGLTQAELGRRSGLPRLTVMRLESGARVPDATQLDRIAKALGLAASELVRRAEERLVSRLSDSSHN